MRIHNVRLGHATNSSSTHSIIYTDASVADYAVVEGDFGWGHFTAASLEAKKLYLAATLFSNLTSQVSDDIALAVVRDWVGITLTPAIYGGVDQSVDHQSLFTLPLEFSGKGINKQFFDEFKDYLLKEGIVILGGNDNDETYHPLSGLGASINLPLPMDVSPLVARKDDSGYWTLFSRSSGNKIRFSFDDLSYAPVRSSEPELVDLKITDYCIEGCAYCYQDSTPDGKHASFNAISNILYNLASEEVLEIAYGGGEPTDHPDFAKIIAQTKYYKITPNFTTKSLRWLKEPWAKQVLDDVGGFAYSVNNHKQIPKFVEAMNKVGYPTYPQRLYIHYVLGSTPMSEYKRILEAAYAAKVQVTLLGYKTTGRGGAFTEFPHENWLSYIKEMRAAKKYIRIGIDTAIVQQYGRTIQLEGISECLYHTQEGKFSCYIDAVTNRIAPSSYSDRSEYKPFDQEWLDTFRKF